VKILIIIPAYNEEDSILSTVRELEAVCPAYDYLVVNDGSTDSTEEILRKEKLQFISLPCNLGIGGAMQAGYLYAYRNDYEIAVQLDGDGQHDPNYLEALIQPLKDGIADMVIGSRFVSRQGFQTTALRRFGNRFIGHIIRLCCGTDVTDSTSGFRAVNREVIRLFAGDYAHDYPEPESIVNASLHDFRVYDIPVAMRARSGGVSSINPIRSVYYMIKVSLSLIICRIRLWRNK